MKNAISVSQEAFDNGAKVAVCSTSNEKAVQGIVDTMLPEFADRCAFFSRTPRRRAIRSIRFDSIRFVRSWNKFSTLAFVGFKINTLSNRRIPVFAGAVVKNKKPWPDIYIHAAETMRLNPTRCVVIEDTHIGSRAGKAAGMRVCVTKSIYTENEVRMRLDEPPRVRRLGPPRARVHPRPHVLPRHAFKRRIYAN